ncbi:molecular chaperone GroES [Aneurinibacillus migulanus]|uniref:co-chaperone GroES n=1 Tax=Aneurinibacillus migulanus TaxID=47500 RepID=UPI0005BC566F|nr:co-chaperone GroES [Aneurinibacillus migulanus]KIV56317.1 molecular chaperone GroES [Aneurinibacillus migulanus]KPD06975.1 molecular chaperone GroES [Aneurinibacillus migulanus]CEH29134.1 10 kDa chaperonin (GroES protein) (Protein Cpn10) [Aneurinibacillus migulanus]
MLKPLGDRVVIEPQKQEEVTASGIVLPEKAKEKPIQGKIIAIGRGRLNNGTVVPLDVHVGDVVLYNKYAGNEIKVEQQEYLIMRESDILAILEPSVKKELVTNG